MFESAKDSRLNIILAEPESHCVVVLLRKGKPQRVSVRVKFPLIVCWVLGVAQEYEVVSKVLASKSLTSTFYKIISAKFRRDSART